MKHTQSFPCIGVDEVGRGPLAGPVTVGIVVLYRKLPIGKLHGLKDSKKLSPKQRALWLEKINEWREKGYLSYVVVSKSASMVDSKGISWCIQEAVKSGLNRICPASEKIFVKLDKGIKAPIEYAQTQYIKGDEKFVEIALASIVAKEHRDAYMRNIAKKYPHYGFDTNVGYGTKKHITALKRVGLIPEHRKSFLRSLAKKE
ncbi:MAG: ribonuclease HII [Candidatus Paceibacterota bacterium]